MLVIFLGGCVGLVLVFGVFEHGEDKRNKKVVVRGKKRLAQKI